MKKKFDFNISVGNISAAWQYLDLARKHKELTVKAAKQIIATSGITDKSDSLSENAFKLCLQINLIDIDDGKIKLTTTAKKEILTHCDQTIPNLAARRAMISQILSLTTYDWLIFFNEDIELFKLSIPDSDWIDILDQSLLFNLTDSEVFEWWKNVLKRYEEFNEKRKKDIGDVGEELSYNYELNRLLEDSIPNPKFYVKWASLFRNDYGYDIASIRSNFFRFSFNEKDKIQIEAKASVFNEKKSFRFLVTKNEWNAASQNPYTYFFYCWLGVDIASGTAKRGPFIVPAISLSAHIPNDISSICEWSECRVVLDLEVFSIN